MLRPLLSAILLLALAQTVAADPLPLEDFPAVLVMDGLPVHPGCVCLTVWPSYFSNYEPKQIYCTIEESGRFEGMPVNNVELDYSGVSCGIVRSGLCYNCPGWGEFHSDSIQEDYHAWHISDDLALVWTEHHDTNGRGIFSELSLVRREGDCLVLADSIAAGDRYAGSIVEVKRVSKEIFEFHMMATPNFLMDSIFEACNLGKVTVDGGSGLAYAVLVWQVSIDEGGVGDNELLEVLFTYGEWLQ